MQSGAVGNVEHLSGLGNELFARLCVFDVQLALQYHLHLVVGVRVAQRFLRVALLIDAAGQLVVQRGVNVAYGKGVRGSVHGHGAWVGLADVPSKAPLPRLPNLASEGSNSLTLDMTANEDR